MHTSNIHLAFNVNIPLLFTNPLAAIYSTLGHSHMESAQASACLMRVITHRVRVGIICAGCPHLFMDRMLSNMSKICVCTDVWYSFYKIAMMKPVSSTAAVFSLKLQKLEMQSNNKHILVKYYLSPCFIDYRKSYEKELRYCGVDLQFCLLISHGSTQLHYRQRCFSQSS